MLRRVCRAIAWTLAPLDSSMRSSKVSVGAVARGSTTTSTTPKASSSTCSHRFELEVATQSRELPFDDRGHRGEHQELDEPHRRSVDAHPSGLARCALLDRSAGLVPVAHLPI